MLWQQRTGVSPPQTSHLPPHSLPTVQKVTPAQKASALAEIRTELLLGSLPQCLVFLMLHEHRSKYNLRLHLLVDSNCTTSMFPPPTPLQHPADPLVTMYPYKATTPSPLTRNHLPTLLGFFFFYLFKWGGEKGKQRAGLAFKTKPPSIPPSLHR